MRPTENAAFLLRNGQCVCAGHGNGVSFFIYFFGATGMVPTIRSPPPPPPPPQRNWFPTQITYSAYNIVHIKQTRSQGHFSIGPRGRGSSKLYIIFLLNGMMNKDELSGIHTPHSNIHTDRHVCTTIHLHTHNAVFADSCAHISQSPKTVSDIMPWHEISLMSFKVTSEQHLLI